MQRLTSENGAVAVVAAIFSVVLFGVAALAVDMGNVYARNREAQTTVDLAALASLANNRDPGCAFARAYTYLQQNYVASDGSSPSTWPPPAADLNDSDLSNGEIVISSADGTRITLSSPSGDTAVACPGTGGNAAKARVIMPPRKVQFALAGVIGFSSRHVVQAATVVLRSLGHVQPLGLPVGCLTRANYGLITLKTSTDNSGTCNDNNGNFGFLDIIRGGAYNKLEENLEFGVDHQLAAMPLGPLEVTPPAGTKPPCPGDGLPNVLNPPEVYRFDLPTPTGTPNCVKVETGNKASDVTDAWIRANNEDCVGLLTRIPSGVTQTRSFDAGGGGPVCTLDARRLSDFTSEPINLALLNGSKGKVIDSSITQSPNFFVVPVLYTDVRPPNGNNFYRIMDFVGFYLDYDSSKCGGCTTPFITSGNNPPQVYDDNGQIVGVTGYVMNLGAIEDGPNTGPVADYFLGTGPAAPVLVKDPLN